MEILVADRSSISESFGILGSKVGPRTGPSKRTHDEKEWFCLRRYIEQLSAAQLLQFPLTLLKNERPDFVVIDARNSTTGVEVTEATTKEYQRELTLSERKSSDGDDAELISDDGFVGDGPERLAAAAIGRAISLKLDSIVSPGYRRTDRYEILVYLNVREFFAVPFKILEIFRSEFGPIISEEFSSCGLTISVSVICGSSMIVDLLGNAQMLNSDS